MAMQVSGSMACITKSPISASQFFLCVALDHESSEHNVGKPANDKALPIIKNLNAKNKPARKGMCCNETSAPSGGNIKSLGEKIINVFVNDIVANVILSAARPSPARITGENCNIFFVLIFIDRLSFFKDAGK